MCESKHIAEVCTSLDRIIQSELCKLTIKGAVDMDGNMKMTTTSNWKTQIAAESGVKTDISRDNYLDELLLRRHCGYYNGIYNYAAKKVEIMPSITDIEVINNCVTIVSFADGTKEKAVTDKQDVFNLEQGISICLTKKLLSQLTFGNGNSAYNKLIKSALKKYAAKMDAIEEQKKIDEQKKRKYAKIAAKKAKRKEKQREARINEQAEAYRRALQLLNTSDSAE